jgi:hypothetical protein
MTKGDAPTDPQVSAEAMDGRCLCGAVTIRTALYRRAVTACHCGICRRWTGGAFFAFGADAAATAVDGPVRVFGSSSFAQRATCGTCGSVLWWQRTEQAEPAYALAAGLFPEAGLFPLTRELYADEAIGCLQLKGGQLRVTRAAYEATHPETQEVAHG